MLPRAGKIKLLGLLAVALMLSMVAAACGDAEPAPLDTAAIKSAVQEAMQTAPPAAAPVSAAEIQQMVKAAAPPAPVSASEIQQMVKGAISEIPAPDIPEQLSTADLQGLVAAAVSASAAKAAKPLSASEIKSLVAAAVTASTGDAATKGEIEALIVKATEEAAVAATEAALMAAPRVVRAAPVSGAAGQKYGGTVKIGVTDFGTMDPALMGLSEGSSLYSELTYDNGTVLWYDGAVTPWALESWTTNDDASQYTFDVRQGIKFHHGKEMKAEDIKFTFDRILDEATASPLQGQISFIENITAVDDHTVVMDLKGPNVFLPAQLTIYHARIPPLRYGYRTDNLQGVRLRGVYPY